MELVILGSGTYQPELKRHASSYLVKIAGQNLVFDFGRGALDQLLRFGLQYSDLNAIFISHLHADHCSELGSFLHISLVEPAVAKLRKKDITIYGPRGTKKALGFLLKAFGLTNLNPPFKVEVKELLPKETVEGAGWKAFSFRVQHDPKRSCLAYRLETEGKILAYSGDSRDCPGLRSACRKADLALLEATWPEEMKSSGHLSAAQAARVAQESGVTKLVLTHIAPYSWQNLELRKEAKKHFQGPLLLAKDLMKIKI